MKNSKAGAFAAWVRIELYDSNQMKSDAAAGIHTIDERATEFANWLDRRSWLVVAAILFFILIAAIGIASHTLLWADDLVTVLTAKLSSFREVWRFYAEGLDTTGPVQSLVGHVGLMLPLPPEISIRIPFILAFLCMCAGIYGFVRRRYPAGYALAALVMPVLFPELYYFMTSARAYALMLGATGVALFFWQSAVQGRARLWSALGLWLVLAMAIAAHFFALFLFVPFALAQLVEDWPRGRPNWPVWLALFLFPLGFLPLVPGELKAKANYLATYHAKPGFRSLEEPFRGIYTSYGWVVVSVLLLLAVWALVRARRDGPGAEPKAARSPGFTPAEWVFAGVLALLPIYQWIGGMVLGAYEPKFSVALYIGLILVIVGGLAEVTRRQAGVGALAFAAVLACAAAAQGPMALRGTAALLHPSRVHSTATAIALSPPVVQRILHSDLPVALEGVEYTGLNYYGDEAFRRRIYVLTDSPDYSDPRYRLTLTGQQCNKLFPRMLPFQSEEIDQFVAQHPHFLVVTSFDMHDLNPIYLLDRQEKKRDLSVTMIFNDPSGSILDVQTK
jgi:hypothetical protein